jgi:outer membrane protein OmpA-like peptidoglycan-associated protein
MKKRMFVFGLSCSVALLAGAQEVTEKQAAEMSAGGKYELVANEGGSQARWYVSPGVGIMMLDGPTDNEPVFFRFSVGYDLTDYLSLEAGMMYAPAHDAEPGVKGGQSAGPTLDVLFHLLGKENPRWDPYLTAGLAYWFANGDLFYENLDEVLVPRIGAGLAYHLTDDLSLRLEGKTGFPTQTRNIDNGWITTVELGLLYRFGGSGNSNSAKSEMPLLPTPAKATPAIQETTPADADDWMSYELYINYDWDKAVIKGEYLDGLNNIARIIKKALAANPNVTVSLEGHADRRHGSGEAYNQKLSENRANGVKDYLVRAGIPAAKINAVGYGFNRPKVEPVDLVNGNPENRRVDLFIRGTGDAASRAKLRAN